MSNLYENIQVIITRTGKGVWVCGSTTPVKDQLKSLGGRWNTSKKCWVFSREKLPQIMELLDFDEMMLQYEEPEIQPQIDPMERKRIKKITKKKELIKKIIAPQELQVIITRTGKGVWVCGQTTPIKDQLKSLGGLWNPSKKCWVFSRQKLPQIIETLNFDENMIQFEEPLPKTKKITKATAAPEITIELNGNGVYLFICKDTYGIKEDLKSKMGALWDRQKRCWQVPIENLSAVIDYFDLADDMLQTLMDQGLITITLSKK